MDACRLLILTWALGMEAAAAAASRGNHSPPRMLRTPKPNRHSTPTPHPHQTSVRTVRGLSSRMATMARSYASMSSWFARARSSVSDDMAVVDWLMDG